MEKSVFISWSGNRGHFIADTLANWLPNVVPNVKFFISNEIEKGTRGGREIARQLEKTDFGIVVLTPESQNAQWINFESGALTKKYEESRLWTFLYEITHKEVTGPLTDFQHTPLKLDQVTKMIGSIHSAVESTVPVNTQKNWVKAFWSQLEDELKRTPSADPPTRSTNEMLLDVEQHIRAIHPLGVEFKMKNGERIEKQWVRIEGTSRERPFAGQPLLPFIGRNGNWWPQGPLTLDANLNWKFDVWLDTGTNSLRIVTPNELGRIFVDFYYRVNEQTAKTFKEHKLKNRKGEDLEGMWLGIKMKRLPPGLEVQAAIDIDCQPPKK